jgi:flagellar biosynthesis anti-sigma factor FlgM
MRINSVKITLEPLEVGKPGRAGQRATAINAASGNSASNPCMADRASFLFDQSRVQTLAAQVLAQPEIRQSKVEPLQEAISNGEFSIPPSQVADALLSEYRAQS